MPFLCVSRHLACCDPHGNRGQSAHVLGATRPAATYTVAQNISGASMSDTDSFIEEVSEEVRRDRMFLMIRRYGWIAVLVIVAIVGGAAYNEYRKASQKAAAQGLGDAIIASMAADEPSGRAAALETVSADTPGGEAILDFLTATALINSGDTAAGIQRLQAISLNNDVPQIYREIATFKALTQQGDTLSVEDRRIQFESLAQGTGPLRLLATEQLALIDLETGETQAALDRLQDIVLDAETDRTLRQRAAQLIIALGETPMELPDLDQG